MIDRMINEVLAGKDPKAVIDLCEKTFTSNDWEKIKKAADKLEKNKSDDGHVKKGGEMIDVVRTSVGNAQVGIEGSGKGYVILGGVSTDFEFGIEEGEVRNKLSKEKIDWLESKIQDLVQSSKGRVDRKEAEYQMYCVIQDGRLKYPDGIPVEVEDVDAVAKEIGLRGRLRTKW